MRRPLFDKSKFAAKHRRLQCVHAIVETDLGMNIRLDLPVIAKRAQSRRGLGVLGDDQPAFSGSAQVFAWIEAEAANRAKRSCAAAIPTCPDRLCRILDDN